MKKLVLIVAFALVSMSAIHAQGVKIGVTGGLLNVNADVKLSVLGLNLANLDAAKGTGFYVGALVDIAATDKLHVQGELTYGSAGDLSYIYLPVVAKYYVADKFHIQVGPQLSFSSNLNEIKKTIRDIDGVLGSNTNIDDVLNSTGVDLSVGAGFDITDNMMIQGRYSFALTDRYAGPLGGGLDVKEGTIQVGFTYFFN